MSQDSDKILYKSDCLLLGHLGPDLLGHLFLFNTLFFNDLLLLTKVFTGILFLTFLYLPVIVLFNCELILSKLNLLF